MNATSFQPPMTTEGRSRIPISPVWASDDDLEDMYTDVPSVESDASSITAVMNNDMFEHAPQAGERFPASMRYFDLLSLY
jgi:hypothetical protein